jgi:mRNA interferase MazF
VVVVDVAFTGRTGSKLRPALVVSTLSFHRKLPDVILCPISSQPRRYNRPGPGDHPLRHWRAARLRLPSTARLSNLLSVEKSLIRRVLGTLAEEDMQRIKAGLQAALGL